jgi:hypothetical protein
MAWAAQSGAADYYYCGRQPVVLRRDPTLVGVDFAGGASPAALKSLRTPDGAVVSLDVVVELPHPGRYVCRVQAAPGASASSKTLIAAPTVLAASPQVQRTYPVFRNPKNGLLVFAFDEIAVRVKPGVGPNDLVRLGAAHAVQVVERNRFEPDIYLLRVGSANSSALDVANEYALSGLCVWAEPNLAGEMFKNAINDPYYPLQWHLNNTGQTGGTPGADVDAPEAWAITAGSPSIVIALIDDGCDLAHEDLAANISHNPGESGGGREGNGVDDDHNGYVDDWRGWDFFDNDNNPDHFYRSSALEGHGTATAGLAAAVGNNGIGVAGLAHRCKILPIKIFKGNYYAGNYEVGNAIRYASTLADVLSNSWGGGEPSEAVESAIRYALERGRGGRGCPVFFSAGNTSTSPVQYPGTSVWAIAVGASDYTDHRAIYSSYGPHLSFLAPSGNYTTDLTGNGAGYDGGTPDTTGNYTGRFGGTSAACPLAAAAGALTLSLKPNLSPLQVQAILQASADKVMPSSAQYATYGFSLQYGYGRLNARRALNLVQQGGRVDDLFEPNNTRQTARLIDNGFYSGLALLNDDWYALDVLPYQDIVAEVYFLHRHGDLQLEVRNPAGVVAASSTGTTNTEEIEVNAGPTGGRWYVHVYGKNGATNYYQMAVSKRPPDDRFEPNDTIATAAPIAPGDYLDLHGYDPDYYRVRVRHGEKLEAVIRFYNEYGDLDLYLLDSTGTLLSESASTRDVEGVRYKNDGPDADFCLFVNNYGDCQNTYQLHLAVVSGQDDRFEENDSRDQAAALPPGTYYGLQAYDYDWYKVAVDPRQVFEAEIRFVNAVGDLDMELYDKEGRMADFSFGTADMERVIFVNTSDTATVLFPLLYPYTANYPTYSLAVGVRPLRDDRFEQNDDLAHARLIVPGTYGDLVALDDDYFGIVAAQRKTIAAIVADEESLPRLGLTLYTPTGIPLVSSVPGQPTIVVARDVPVGGINKLRVSLPPGGKVNLYGLSVFVYDTITTPTTRDDRFEPNNLRVKQAATVLQGVYPDLYCANDDYYKIHLFAGDSLYVGILFSSAEADLDLELLDPWGQHLALSAGTADSELCVLKRAPVEGAYYIRVWPQGGGTNYDLLIGRWIPQNTGQSAVRHWTYY